MPDKVSGLVSQSIVEVITSRESDLTWREAVDSDNQKGEELFTSGEGKEYVWTDGDIRKLYEMRPIAQKCKGTPPGKKNVFFRAFVHWMVCCCRTNICK